MITRSGLAVAGVLALIAGGCSSGGAAGAGNASDRALSANGTHTQPGPFRKPGEVAFIAGRGRLVGIVPATHARRVLATCVAPCRAFSGAAWSADGRWLAYGVATCAPTITAPPYGCDPLSGLWVRSRTAAPEHLISTCRGNSCTYDTWQWAPRGAIIAVASTTHYAGQVSLIDPVNGASTPLVHTDGPISNLAWSPDGTRIAYAHGADIDVIAVADKQVRVAASGIGSVVTLVWSPDSRQIAIDPVTKQQSQVAVVAAGGGSHATVGSGTSFEGPGLPAWSPAGNRLAYITTRGHSGHYRADMWTVAADGSHRRLLYRTPVGEPNFSQPVWSPDGTWVATHLQSGWLAVQANRPAHTRHVSDLRVQAWLQRQEQPQETSG